ncbi:MAG TPA: pentapeptide repeat-containing protein, partial [bacterium]|nr:pentapeptide repeat-containing protein [bacterium]
KVLLSLLMLARPGRDVIKRTQLTFESRNLAGLRFMNRDLSGVSFRQSDLSHGVFRDCDLRGALFEGTFLHRTRFEGDNDLRDARFGDSSRAFSIFVGSKLLDDPGQIKEWLAARTGRPVPTAESCPTALQLRYLFGKYITPLGTPKRDYLKHDALVAGRQYPGAARPEACLDEAVSEGYLTGPDFRNRFRRAEGDKYAEMVRLVRDGSISDHLGQIISRVCQRRACLHEIHA